MLKDAIDLATRLHEWQKRKTGEDYITHPLSVMGILKRHKFPEEVLVCAVLHDICEDTETTNIEIRDEFWDRVWFIVNALTKNKKPRNNAELKKKYEEMKKGKCKYDTFEEYVDYRFHLYINRFTVGIIADPWIMFIKMADQIDNTRTLHIFSEEKRQRKINELENFFLPMYANMEELVTPMYKPKYDALLEELNGNINKAKEL